jgi:putative DNA primase/helicase
MLDNEPEIVNVSGEPCASSDSCTANDSPQTEETSACPMTGIGLDEAIQEAIDSIGDDCSPSALEVHVRALGQILLAHKASSVTTLAALNLLNRRLRDLGLPSIGKRVWEKTLEAIAATDAINNPTASNGDDPQAIRVRIRDIFPDAPVTDDAVVPLGWRLTTAGVFQAGVEMPVEVLTVPLFIKTRLLDDSQQTEAVRLTWKRDGRWHERVCPRSTIAVTHKITDLADYGLPVDSLKAAGVVAYLSAFEASNKYSLPRIQIRRQLGWVNRQASGFLWGRTYLRASRPVSQTETPAPAPNDLFDCNGSPTLEAGESNQDAADAGSTGTNVSEYSEVHFEGADAGDEQVADAHHARGTFQDWKAAVEPPMQYPVARLATQASLAAPLLTLLVDDGARNFTIDVCCESSMGKTSILRLAGSAYGDPREDSPTSILTSWSTTRVAAERRAGLVNGLPTIRDDTKLATHPEEVAQVIYEVSEGRTHDRGTIRGLDRTTSFSTILLISGEARAVSFSGDGGTRARIITLWGKPFGKADAETAQLVKQLNDGIARNYGHAGPKFVQFVLDHPQRWPEWRKQYVEIRESYSRKAVGNSVVGRLADAFALLDLCGILAGEALGMPSLKDSAIEPLWELLTAEAGDADRALDALRYAFD